MKPYQTINPFTEEKLFEVPFNSASEVKNAIQISHECYKKWSDKSIAERILVVQNISELLILNKEKLANLISTEMGKPIKQSLAEIQKCADTVNGLCQIAESALSSDKIDSDKTIFYQPLGVIYGIMPWNFPLWQVIRFAIPTLLAGNTVIIKHSENTPQVAKEIEKIFSNLLFQEGLYQNLFIDYTQSNLLIADKRIKGVSLTGSERAGKEVASVAGKWLKPIVLELGGSDAFIVLEDADIDKAVDTFIQSRFLNTGQSCVASKRLLLHDNIEDAFLEKLKYQIDTLSIGNPLEEWNYIGTIARKDLLDTLHQQVLSAIEEGNTILYQNKNIPDKGYFYPPTLIKITNASSEVCTQELFGPVAMIRTFSNNKEALDIANETDFGLGCSLFTNNQASIEYFTKYIESGMLYINQMVKSIYDAPFGGIKNSGIGRELGISGFRAFTNQKTVCFG